MLACLDAVNSHLVEEWVGMDVILLYVHDRETRTVMWSSLPGHSNKAKQKKNKQNNLACHDLHLVGVNIIFLVAK